MPKKYDNIDTIPTGLETSHVTHTKVSVAPWTRSPSQGLQAETIFKRPQNDPPVSQQGLESLGDMRLLLICY